MKKKMLGVMAVAVIAAVIALNVDFKTKNTNISGISLPNVEALAIGEGGYGCCGPNTYRECLCLNTLPCSSSYCE